ncbi:MAG: GspE/PulE family protein [Candidatus Dactylopiibacterium sp.]|nr:GspE/PulE family protein [Candidatus Dactylopiibacterium sp.]
MAVVQTPPLQHAPIGRLLVEQRLISADQLRITQHEQARTGQAIGPLLVSLGFVTEHALRAAHAQACGLAEADLARSTPDKQAQGCVPEPLARRLGVFPLSWDATRRHLELAIARPDDLVITDQLAAQLPQGVLVTLRVAGEDEIRQAIERHYGHKEDLGALVAHLERAATEPLAPGREAPPSQAAVHLVDAVLQDAVRREASDIHFEPERHLLRIRYRIDGLLREILSLHAPAWPALAVRLKVMADIDIAENRSPQDGRISQVIGGRPIDFRVSTLPTLHGENIVLRILDRQRRLMPLAGLGLAPTQLARLRIMIARPEGLLVFTGPTGSGKTTTLYSILHQLDAARLNIMTLEDPVEYPLPGIRQSTISEESRLGFAEGVRAMMRQDPDVILIGEIRDAETASMALRAAMTGHQVHATLHSGSALGTLVRLQELGVRPDILAGNLIGAVAQRLVRRLCPHCREPRMPTATERELLDETGTTTLFDATGCPLCDGQGYRGRLALMEILRMNAELDELVAAGASRHALKRAARAGGCVSLVEDGLRAVRAGLTTLEELGRVVDLTERQHAMPDMAAVE